jgi:hypothetical protein
MVMPETMYLNRPLTIGWRDTIQFAVSLLWQSINGLQIFVVCRANAA